MRGATLGAVAISLALAWTSPASGQGGKPLRSRTAYEDLQMFSQVLNQIRVNHPDSVDMHRLFMAAVEGMVRAVDPHSYVLPAARLAPEKEKQLREGKLYPVPIRFVFFGGSPVVTSVAPGSSADEVGILPGDELVAVDGQPVEARSEEELDIALAGPKGSTVALSLERRRIDGSLATLRRAVRRERVEEVTVVPAAFMLDAQTGYVRITSFMSDRVEKDLEDALRRLERDGMRRLLLDLRDNGGGSVQQAAKVAGAFLPAGSVVYTAEGRKQEIHDTVRVERGFWRSEKPFPLVVLVNAGTASAAELVAGALQDYDRAVIVGRPTFGKSLLMRTFPMSDGSLLVLVVGNLRTPCGRIIQRRYRDITARDYYRLALAERDTVGRPSCRTAAGRTVYGGGGIYPDVVLSGSDPVPVWLARIVEENLPLQWVGGYIAEAASLSSLDALAAEPRLPASAIEAFRRFAIGQGFAVPEGAEAAALLQRVLVRGAAAAKWGDGGRYRISAVLDAAVAAAVEAFGQAESVLSLAQ